MMQLWIYLEQNLCEVLAGHDCFADFDQPLSGREVQARPPVRVLRAAAAAVRPEALGSRPAVRWLFSREKLSKFRSRL